MTYPNHNTPYSEPCPPIVTAVCFVGFALLMALGVWALLGYPGYMR